MTRGAAARAVVTLTLCTDRRAVCAAARCASAMSMASSSSMMPSAYRVLTSSSVSANRRSSLSATRRMAGQQITDLLAATVMACAREMTSKFISSSVSRPSGGAARAAPPSETSDVLACLEVRLHRADGAGRGIQRLTGGQQADTLHRDQHAQRVVPLHFDVLLCAIGGDLPPRNHLLQVADGLSDLAQLRFGEGADRRPALADGLAHAADHRVRQRFDIDAHVILPFVS